jgi:hypothetical protein
MRHVTTSSWARHGDDRFERARVLDHGVHPEGLDLERLRFPEAATLPLATDAGHVVSVVNGEAHLSTPMASAPLRLEAGVHAYVPPHASASLSCAPGSFLLWARSPNASQARGARLLVRDEQFVAACAAGSHSLRWILTPQYLSRRIFLHHDETLVSRRGDPVSWFHTTMFDVAGLPPNEDGESVFKMAYNSRTEINVCYDVTGDARVRVARHPHVPTKQAWGPWSALTSETNYHLHEAVDGDQVEWIEEGGKRRSLRNKHEVLGRDGYVSLFCMFDPAPTGVERHRPGEYSDYEPLADVIERPEYAAHREALGRFDEMVDTLSLAKASGTLSSFAGTPIFALYEAGARAQAAIERTLATQLAEAGGGREKILARWMRKQPE